LNKKKLEILEDVIQDAINEALEETEYAELHCDKVEIGKWFFMDDYYGSIRIKIHD
jgi:DNA-binding protein YbaB